MAKNSKIKNQPIRGPRRPGRNIAEAIELLPPTKPATTRERWLPIAMVVFLATVVYVRCADNEFVTWDDDHYIYKNHQIHYNDGIKSIWTDVLTHKDPKFISKSGSGNRVSHQYYPLVFTLYWLEFRFHVWFNGADPEKTIEQNIADGKMTARSFHVVSVVLHALNTVLLIWCLRALGLSNWVAWAAAILFAVHPMQVASVAWAAERKNIMSLMFYLLSLMVYIKMRREGKWWRYVLALVLFQAALFSKTVALTLPVMLFITDRLLERRWDFRLIFHSVLRILPFVALSCVAALTTMKVEDRDRDIPLTNEQRPFVPCASLLFYPAKMLAPVNLSPVYELWEPDPTKIRWYLPIIGVMAIGALVVRYRKTLGPHFIWALLLYCVTQAPMLGFKDINYFQFSLVADHYFYHGSVGLFVLLALGLDVLRRKLSPPSRGFAVATALVAIGVGVYGMSTFYYCDVWETPDRFWARTLEMNDTCWPAYFNTANARSREANSERDPVKRAALLDDAAERYQRVTKIRTRIVHPFDRLLDIYWKRQKWTEGLETAEEAARRFTQLIKYRIAACAFAAAKGDIDRARTHFRTALEVGNQMKWLGLREDYSEMMQNLETAAKTALNEERFEDVIPCYTWAGQLSDELARSGGQAEALRGLQDAMVRYRNAGAIAEQIGRTEDIIKYFQLAADRALRVSELYGKASNPCGVMDGYNAASRFLLKVYQTDPRDDEIKLKANAIRKKYEEAKLDCPEGQ